MFDVWQYHAVYSSVNQQASGLNNVCGNSTHVAKLMLAGACCREAGRYSHADALLEGLAESCASERQFSEAASHMLQLAQDTFAAVKLAPFCQMLP